MVILRLSINIVGVCVHRHDNRRGAGSRGRFSLLFSCEFKGEIIPVKGLWQM